MKTTDLDQRCENCSSASKLPGERIVLHRTVGRGLVCAACIRANVERDPAFAIDRADAARRMELTS